MSTYSIKDLEHVSGIKAHTIRIWEQRYGLLNPDRTDTNIRFYSDNDLKLILNVAILKDNGFKISKIAHMPHEQINHEVAELSDHFSENEYMSELTVAMLDMDEARFERIMTQSTDQRGFEQTMIDIVYPFLHRIGILWITGSIVPAQEHFISNLIRRKIVAATDQYSKVLDTTSEKFVLFLPEGEMHEISLLFADFMIRSRGRQSLYLGQSVPLSDVITVCEQHKPKYVLTILTSSSWMEEEKDIIGQLSSAVADSTLLLSGFQVANNHNKMPDNTTILRSFEDLSNLIG